MLKFFSKHAELPEGSRTYRKKTTIKAVKIVEEFEVVTLEGRMKGKPGDYLAQGIKGELYPVDARIFEETYDEVRDA
jgi:hypothetical protein